MEEEKWIKILHNNYSVSCFGNLRTEDRFIVRPQGSFFQKSRLLNHHDNGKGYRYFSTVIRGLKRNYYVHKMVAECFVLNPENKPEINHKDGNKSNNHFLNLEWVTKSENQIHAYKFGLQAKGKDRSNAIKLINTSSLQVFGCIKEAADFYNIKYGLLKDNLNRNKNCIHRIKIYGELKRLTEWAEANPKAAKEQGFSENRLT